MRPVRRVAALAWLCLFAVTPFAQAASDPAPTAADWSEIKRIIAAQREALVAGDGERAFGFAAPPIREQHRTAAAFLRMVRESYAALIDARYVEFLDGAVIGGEPVQPLRLVMPDGTVLVAIYGMRRQSDGTWRIGACIIAPSTVRSAMPITRTPGRHA